jgi:glycosyltransferase involved in cell wall biosynthesis
MNIRKKRNLSILVLLPYLVKGSLAYKIFRELTQSGFDVTFLFSNDCPDFYQKDPFEYFSKKNRLIDLTKIKSLDRLNFLNEEVRERGIDLIVQIGAFDLYEHLPYLKELNPELRILDVLYNQYGHTLNHFLYEKCFDGVIVESEFMRNFINKASNNPNLNVFVLYSGVDVKKLRPKRYHYLQKNKLTIGFIGRLSAEKNPLGFLELANNLQPSFSGLSFYMLGNGNEQKEVLNLIKNNKNKISIIYKPYIEDIKRSLHEIDVLIVPSKFDGRPNVIMEANACGIPVIASAVGGIQEMIFEEKNGYLIDYRNTSQINNIFSEWFNQPATLVKLKKSSRAFAVSIFNQEMMFKCYANTFINVCSS